VKKAVGRTNLMDVAKSRSVGSSMRATDVGQWMCAC
jgi:hypothetical protein